MLECAYTLTGHFIRYTCSIALSTQIANQPITWQQLNAFRHLDVVKTTCWSSNRASERGRKGICDFERGMVVGGLSISETADLLGFSRTTISRVYREWSKKRKYPASGSCVDENALMMSEVRGEWARLVRDDRKATVTQITTRYNQSMQNTISEHTTHRTLKQSGSSSRRPHRVPLLSAKNMTQRLLFAQAHQNWTTEDWKKRCLVWWVSISVVAFRCRVRIWRKDHESMDLSCLVSMVQVGGVGGVIVWGIFSWHTLGLLVPIEHRLNASDYLSIVADHVHPFMTTVYHLLMYFQQDNEPCHKDQIISDWFLEHDNEFTLLKWPPQSPDLNQ